MASNYPPGVTEGMIPGNRPEDAEWEQLDEWLVLTGLDPTDIRLAIKKYDREAYNRACNEMRDE